MKIYLLSFFLVPTVLGDNESELNAKIALETKLQGGENVTSAEIFNLFKVANDRVDCPSGSTNCEKRKAIFDHIEKSFESCEDPVQVNELSIAHRGACLLYPEHSVEGYTASILQGASSVECDVAITKDFELVCRHDNCDLATTTDVLQNDTLASKCSIPFSYNEESKENSVKCCTYDFTLEEFRSMKALMDGSSNSSATTKEFYRLDPPAFRSTNYEPATLITHAESAALFVKHKRNLIPELKTCDETCQSKIGKTDIQAAEKLVKELQQAVNGTESKVILQTFDLPIALFWKTNQPENDFPVCYLWGTYTELPFETSVKVAADAGIEILGAPLYDMIDSDGGFLVESELSKNATKLGMKKALWTLERSACEDGTAGACGWYYTDLSSATNGYHDTLLMMYTMVHESSNFIGVFSDYPLTMTAFANCVPKLNENQTGSPTVSPTVSNQTITASPTISPTVLNLTTTESPTIPSSGASSSVGFTFILILFLGSLFE